MSYKSPIAWQHGQFLQPQHFQLADLNQQTQIAALLSLIQPYYWGFSQFELDVVALERGQLIVNNVQLFWQDGSYLNSVDNAIVIQRLIPVDFFKERKQLDVFIGLKRLDPTKANATVVQSQNLATLDSRYMIEQVPRVQADLYQQGPEANVSQLTYVLKLFFLDEIQVIQGYDLLPLVSINQQQQHCVAMNDVCPAITQLSAYTPFWDKLKESEALWIQAYQFSLAHRPSQSWYQLRIGESEIGNYLLIQTLHRLLPPLLNLLKQKNTHPFSLHQQLQQAIHELNFFVNSKAIAADKSSSEMGFLSYDHQKPAVSLLAGQACLNEMLNKILMGPQYCVSLKQTGNHYEAQLPSQFLVGNDHFYLIIQSVGTSDKAFMEHIISAGKLTSAQVIDDYIKHAIPGVPLSYLSSRPTGAPDIAGAVYFQIDCKNPEWSGIVQKATVGFYPGNIQEALTVDMVAARGN